MKKAAVVILFLILSLCLFEQARAAAVPGNCIMTPDNQGFITHISWACTGNSSDGTFPTTGFASPALRGWVFVVTVTPGGTPPTAGSGVTLINSAAGDDVMGGNCSTSVTTSATRCVPAKSGWTSNGTLQPVITGSTAPSATFTIDLWLWRQQ